MLPYANKLHEARFLWDRTERNVRSVPGQKYGIHGFAHRLLWRINSQDEDSVQLIIEHVADDMEWPWSFMGMIDYALSGEGLTVTIQIRNDSSTSMPAVLGWHPYVPSVWLKDGTSSGVATAMHELDKNGNCDSTTFSGNEYQRLLYANLSLPHTVAMQNWSSPWSVRTSDGMKWCLTADSQHLVHHMPNDLAYACIEPVTALPGILNSSTAFSAKMEVNLQPAATRRLTCRLYLTE